MLAYQEQKEKSLSDYEQLNQKYQQAILSENFERIRSEIIFDILKCRYLSDILQVYKTTDSHIIPKFPFKSGEEAKDIFLNIIQFKKSVEPLLNNVAYVDQIIHLKNQINQLVQENDYLPDTLLLPSLGRIEEIVKDALKELPEYQKNTTKEFKNHFIESCIYSLSEEHLNILIQNRIIKASDLDNIKLAYDSVYNQKIEYLCNVFGHQPLNIVTVDTRIKGSTFLNEDGSNRQEYLKELATKHSQHEQKIYIKPFLFKPEIGKEEPAAYVMWDNKCLGFIDKTIIAEAEAKYENITYSAEIKSIRNKDDKFGCELTLTITSPKMIERTEELEKN